MGRDGDLASTGQRVECSRSVSLVLPARCGARNTARALPVGAAGTVSCTSTQLPPAHTETFPKLPDVPGGPARGTRGVSVYSHLPATVVKFMCLQITSRFR